MGLQTLLKRLFGGGAAQDRPAEVALFFHLGGDIDILTPFLEARRAYPDVRFRIIAAEPLLEKSLRLKLAFAHYGVTPDAVLPQEAGDEALRAALGGAGALVTSSESTLRPHRLAHALTKAANAAGVATFTLQHGVENVGLTWFDATQGPEVVFAAGTVFTWQDPAALPDVVDPATRAKAVGVGYADPPLGPFEPAVEAAMAPFAGKPVIGVLENLHWTRYSDEYRTHFLDDLLAACAAHPEAVFLMKPHPEGRWLTQRFKGDRPASENLVIADPADPVWGPITAPVLVPRLSALISTPSKAAMDGVLAGIPVAISAYDGADGPYAALPALAKTLDWLDFAARALGDPASFEAANAACLGRILTGRDPMPAMMGAINRGARAAAIASGAR